MRLPRPISSGRIPRRAFTLIELILVMVLLLVVFGVAFPTLQRFFRGRNLDSEARRFLALTRAGQSRAVYEGLPMVLWMDTRQGGYGLQAAPGFLDTDTNALEFFVDEKLTFEVVASPTNSAPTFQQTPTLVGPPSHRRAAGNLPTIRFTPEGVLADSSPAQIVFRAADGSTVSLAPGRNRLNYEIQTSQPNTTRR